MYTRVLISLVACESYFPLWTKLESSIALIQSYMFSEILSTFVWWQNFYIFERGHIYYFNINPDSKVRVANMGPTWVLASPGGPHVGPMNLAIRESVIAIVAGDAAHNYSFYMIFTYSVMVQRFENAEVSAIGLYLRSTVYVYVSSQNIT